MNLTHEQLKDMKDKKIILIGDSVMAQSYKISELIEKMGEDIIVVENGKITYPANLKSDDVIHLGNEDVSTNELLKMVQDLKTSNEIDGFIDNIRRSADIPLPTVENNSFMFDRGSSFIPSKGGTQANSYKSGKGKNKGRRY